MRWSPAVALSLCAHLLGCTSGPGRVPVFPDAEDPFDGGFLDANPRPDAMLDAGPPDSEVVLFDSGEPPIEYPFTGQFMVMGQQDRMFAREVRGRLSIIFGGVPFVYDGDISEDGTFSVVSGPLTRSGCSTARISGSYQRLSATVFFTLEGCAQDGTPFTNANLRGFFERDYDLQFSGIYQIAAILMSNDFNCYTGPGSVMEIVWAVNMLPGSNAIEIHVAADMIPGQAVYVGRLEQPDFTFAALQSIYAQSSVVDVSMRGNLTRSGTDPPTITGTRDVYDPVRQCYFGIGFQGVRVSNF